MINIKIISAEELRNKYSERNNILLKNICEKLSDKIEQAARNGKVQINLFDELRYVYFDPEILEIIIYNEKPERTKFSLLHIDQLQLDNIIQVFTEHGYNTNIPGIISWK